MKVIFKTLGLVFSNYHYWLLAVLIFILAFSWAILSRNLSLIVDYLSLAGTAWTDKLLFLLRLWLAVFTSVSVISWVLLLIVAALFSLNVSLLIFYIKQYRQLASYQASLATLGGIASGVLGISCLSCGSLLLSAILATLGGSGLVALLPLGGAEFSLLAIVLLSLSIFWLCKTITRLGRCVV